MKSTILLLALSFLLVNCSSEDSNTPQSTFAIQLEASSSNIAVDEPFTVNLSANEEISEAWISTNNFATGSYVDFNFGMNYNYYFNFDDIGTHTISVRAKNKDNVTIEKSINVNVVRGNAIKINGIQVVTFNGINTVFDPEYPASNPESLADLVFGFSKPLIGLPFENIYTFKPWYRSEVLQNQGNLTWNCSSANLYLKPELSLYFGLADADGPNVGQDLTYSAGDYVEIGFLNYLATKPTTITYTFPAENLEFKVFVEWPN